MAAIKNPPIIYARQENISIGPQQFKNGVQTYAREIESLQNKLLVGENEQAAAESNSENIGVAET